MSINEIPKFCINLEERKDRWNSFLIQKDNYPFLSNTERFNAIKHARGAEGCKLSYLTLFDHCIQNNINEVLILEDDVLFLNDVENTLQLAINQLPENWDLLYLGLNTHKKLDRYSDNLFKVKSSFATHAILYNNRNNVMNYIIEKKDSCPVIDVFYSNEIQPKFQCFTVYPIIATQNNSYSDIEKKVINMNFIVDRFYTNTR